MDHPSGRLASLVRSLDALDGQPSLTQLAGLLSGAKLTMDDVASHVKHADASYHRASVVRREHYELLVLTWLPGQGSAPHDHSGSVSAMLVMQGEAIEASWQIASDGYVDLADRVCVPAGEMTAWQDAGVHTVRNDHATTPMVSVHIYAPPLGGFRRFVPRPRLTAHPRPSDARPPTVVVVGGGFSGSMTAAQLLRQANEANLDLRVALVERQGAVGEGIAYGTRDTQHLLNVPAGRMSAWPDRPDDFFQWAERRHDGVAPGDFLPRPWFGEYVRETLLDTANAPGHAASLSVMFDEVRRIARRPGGGWMVHFERGMSMPADAVVLAIGHRSPPDPIGDRWSGPRTRFVADPWRPFAANIVQPNQGVVVLGTGLSAIDTVLTLSSQPRTAPIWLVSRRGLLPQTHATSPVAAVDLGELVAGVLANPEGVHTRTLLHRMRQKAREVVANGGDWRSVVDGLRPHTAALWRAMGVEQRRTFLRAVRPYWEVHRHRMATTIARRFAGLVEAGLVKVIAGTVAAAQADDAGVRLYVRERGDERLVELRAGLVLNCTGPAASNSPESNPAIGSLLVHGFVRPDPLMLGLETSPDGEAIDIHGDLAPDLFVVGTLRKFAAWETTAVPELRGQAAAIASRCLLHAQRGAASTDLTAKP